MDGALHLAPIGGIAAAGLRIVGAVDFFDFAGLGVLDEIHALDDVAIAQAHFAPWRQAEILGRRHLAEIVLVDVNAPGRTAPCACRQRGLRGY